MSGEILSNEEMRRADDFAAMAGMPPLTLMENAGRAVADAIAARFSPCRVAGAVRPRQQWRRRLCGGAAAGGARLRCARGEPAMITRAMPPPWRSDGTAARVPLTPAALEGAALVVDALFGAGLSRPLDGDYARDWSRRVNRCPCPGRGDRCAQRR